MFILIASTLVKAVYDSKLATQMKKNDENVQFIRQIILIRRHQLGFSSFYITINIRFYIKFFLKIYQVFSILKLSWLKYSTWSKKNTKKTCWNYFEKLYLFENLKKIINYLFKNIIVQTLKKINISNKNERYKVCDLWHDTNYYLIWNESNENLRQS